MNAAESAFLGLVRAAGACMRGVERLLKRHGLTAAQYNILRILRGAGERGACGREIAGQLITAEPDITRLLDRMEKRGLIARQRDAKDRRFVTARITRSGLETLAALDAPVAELHRRQLGSLSGAELKQLSAATEKLRAALEHAAGPPELASGPRR